MRDHEDRTYAYRLGAEEDEWIYVKGRYGGRVRRKVKTSLWDDDDLPSRNCFER